MLLATPTFQNPDSPYRLDVPMLSQAIRDRSLTSVQVVSGYLDRIRKHDGWHQAFLAVYAEEALAHAAELDRLLATGTWLGPLHGIPIAIKDAVDIEGRITTFGSMHFPAKPAPASAALISRLRGAGAIILGKTHMVQFALGAWGINDELGTPRNPWDHNTHRVPGGSSSGSAVAVAADLVPLAIGTDTGGSVRVPAAFCGITGFKPSTRALDLAGVLPLSVTLDSLGIFAHSVEDVVLLYDAVRDDADPAQPGLQAISSLQGVKLARLGAADLAGTSLAVLQAYEAAVATMAEDGATISTVRLPCSFAESADVASTIMLAEAAAAYGAMATDRTQPIDAPVRQRILAGTRVDAVAYIAALQSRAKWMAAYQAFTAGLDAVLMPTTPDTAVETARVDHLDPPIKYTRMLNLLDLAGVSIPNGFDDHGLPTGLQVVATSSHGDRVLAIAHRFQTLTDWHTRRPAVVPGD